MHQQSNGPINYKRTTDKQYHLLKQRMAIMQQKNKNSGNHRYKRDTKNWIELTETLNRIGPPYRTLPQWKKVWSDYRRSENRRKSKANIHHSIIQSVKAVKMKTNDNNANNNNDNSQEHSSSTLYPVQPKIIKTEMQIKDYNSDSMHITYSNDYDNDYSYADNDSEVDSYKNETVVPDESSCTSYNYGPPDLEDSTQLTFANHSSDNINYITPPPLKHASAPLIDQTLYTLHNQIEHQTKLLEHMSGISNTMAGLLERQTEAIEKQTQAVLRQAAATEKHTVVMNTFLDMIKTKMIRGNLPKADTVSTTNSENDVL